MGSTPLLNYYTISKLHSKLHMDDKIIEHGLQSHLQFRRYRFRSITLLRPNYPLLKITNLYNPKLLPISNKLSTVIQKN